MIARSSTNLQKILKVQLMDENKKARLYDMLYEKKDEIKDTLDRYKNELNGQEEISNASMANYKEEVSGELSRIRDSVNSLFHEIYF